MYHPLMVIRSLGKSWLRYWETLAQLLGNLIPLNGEDWLSYWESLDPLLGNLALLLREPGLLLECLALILE